MNTIANIGDITEEIDALRNENEDGIDMLRSKFGDDFVESALREAAEYRRQFSKS